MGLKVCVERRGACSCACLQQWGDGVVLLKECLQPCCVALTKSLLSGLLWGPVGVLLGRLCVCLRGVHLTEGGCGGFTGHEPGAPECVRVRWAHMLPVHA